MSSRWRLISPFESLETTVPRLTSRNRLKSAKQAVSMEHQLGTFEGNQKRYREMMEQPLITALRSPIPEIAVKLLERGADPNVITCDSHRYMNYSWRQQFTGQSALDIADEQIRALRGYKGETTEVLSPPQLPEGIDTYLSNFEEGSYQHWLVSMDIEQRRDSYRKTLARYEEHMASSADPPGVREKTSTIEKATTTMKEVKKALLAKGAKPFVEIHPDFKDSVDTSNRRYQSSYQNKETKSLPYEFTFSFRNVNDVTGTRKEAYLKL